MATLKITVHRPDNEKIAAERTITTDDPNNPDVDIFVNLEDHTIALGDLEDYPDGLPDITVSPQDAYAIRAVLMWAADIGQRATDAATKEKTAHTPAEALLASRPTVEMF